MQIKVTKYGYYSYILKFTILPTINASGCGRKGSCA